MATIDWPLTLPQVFQQSGYTEGDVDNVLVTQMDAGPQKRRRKSTEAYMPISGTMLIDGNQKDIFDDFHKLTIASGALPFNFPTYDGGTTEAFMDSKRITPTSGTTWKLTMQLTVLV